MSPPSSTAVSRPALPGVAGIAALVLATVAAYWNSFSVPFLYDDASAIVENPSLRHLWPIGPVLAPPAHLTTTGRPLVNASLAVNYAFGGLDVRGYHAVNLAIHLLAALTLFGLVRRTLLRPPLAGKFGAAARPLALAIAALWCLHPLQTEAVTYVVQRAESLVALFYLLTLYAFVRGVEPGASRGWFPAAIGCCLLGMSSKEVMVSAPLVVFLYDRTFVAGSFRAAWTRHRALYLGLAASWLLLGWLVVTTGGTRDGSAGFGQGVAWWAYALTQARAIALYLRLAVWPGPLIFDYGRALVPVGEALPFACGVAVLLAAVGVALWRRPVLGFVGFAVAAILAPSSSVVPVVTETMAEHRLYLPLAAVLATLVLLGYARFGRGSLLVGFGAAAVFGGLTAHRNLDYQSPIALWSDTVAKLPGNPRAHNQLGSALAAAGREPEALAEYQEAVRLDPADGEAHFNFAEALSRAGRFDAAAGEFERALHGRVAADDVHNNYGLMLMRLGRRDEAVRHYREALQVNPQHAPAHNNLGVALGSAGQLTAAVDEFRAALLARPDYAEADNNLGYALAQLGRPAEAVPCFQTALRLDPRYAQAHANLGQAWERLGRTADARAEFETTLQLTPDRADVRQSLAALEAATSVAGAPASARP